MLFGFRTIQKKKILTINTIIEIQQILEENNAGVRKLPGTALRNSVTGKVIYTPPDKTDVIYSLLSNLEKFINLDEDEIPHLIKMAIQHYQFESIHPFYDGNGRTGRILNILYLIMSGLLEQPILFLSGYIIENKSEYYRLLQAVRTNNKWEDWILYILKGVEITAQATINQVTEINALFDQIKEKTRKEIPKIYSKELIELLFEHPYSKSEYLENRLDISRITAAKYLKALENIGVLQSKKVWKETLYINTALFEQLKKY
jgi:Fic family protein